MKKIAIQTLRLHANYGGLLQAFALYKFIQNLGHEVIVLNTAENYDINKRTFTQKCKSLIARLLISERRRKHRFHQIKKKINQDFNKDFTEKYINLTPPLYNYEEWSNYILKNKIEILIAGSDQVWRLAYNEMEREQCFLDYNLSPLKKLSYAASLGVSKIDKELRDCLLKYLLSFETISVREIDSAKMLAEIGLKSEVCLDPTLLFTAKDYINFFDLKKIEEDFIFAYILDYEQGNYNIEPLLKDPNIKLKIQEDLTVKNAQKKDFKKCSVIEWLQNIYSSKFIITDSFHGVVFSIIFKKPFYVKVNHERGASRFISLLSQLDLMDRFWDGTKIEPKEIDYDSVYNKLDGLKTSSIEFLKENLI